MRLVILYHPKSEQEGPITDYARDYKRSRGRDFELISLETQDGANLAKVHDVVRYPAILMLDDRGGMIRLWQGWPLPLMNDLDAYTVQTSVDST